MRVVRRILAGGLVAAVAACGSDGGGIMEPGVLTITLNGPPPTLTNSGTLQLTGQVVRTPAAPGQHLVVSVSGAPSGPPPDTAADDGSFSFSVGLALNAENNLSVTATDQAGSTATPVTLTVTHDGQPPQVAAMTPTSGSDGVTAGTVQVLFGEAIVPGSAAFDLRVYGTSVPGSAVVSPDSLTLTFTPSAPLVSNAVHAVTVTGAADAVGNTLVSAGGCFTTAGAGISQFVDTSTVLYQYGSPSGLVPPDLLELRLARTASILYGILEFDAPRSLTPTAANNTSVWMDLDIDQDGGTGFVPFKDVAFAGFLPSSGAGSEYFVEIGTLDGVDGAVVAQITAQDIAAPSWEFTVTDRPTPAACGSVLGFAIPFAAIGNDDGAFDITMYVDVFRPDPPNGSAIVDPTPDEGVFSAALTTFSAVAPTLTAAIPPSSPTARATLRRPIHLRVR